MGLSVDYYAHQRRTLQPAGPALPADPGSNWQRLTDALADELARADSRALALFSEADPRTTYEMIRDWERLLGVSGGFDDALQVRRARLTEHITRVGGQSISYILDRASNLGFNITISEFHRDYSLAGVLTAGDELFADISQRLSFRVNVAVQAGAAFTAGASTAGDTLGSWSPDRLVDLIERIKPAHARVIWNYT